MAAERMPQPRCLECGAMAHYGYGVRLAIGVMGSWYCKSHRSIGEARLASGDIKARPEATPPPRGDQEKKVVRKNDQGSLL